MAGMYPNNQDIEIFGEQVQWPGVDADGKFTNGSFSDPMAKPSFIPAETVNLVLDNLERLIEKCGGTPNATNQNQLADLLSHLGEAKKIIMRDENGRAQVAAPEAAEDIARLAEITASFNAARNLIIETEKRITPDGFGLYVPDYDLLIIISVNIRASRGTLDNLAVIV